MSLSLYNKKRDFKQTSEPSGKPGGKNQFRFVVQRHEASRLHYDFRLELEGALKSWAVPKGPSLNPATKRLAVMVEDHPVSYINFRGRIPEGNYGAGNVEIWDKGHFKPVDENNKPINEKQALLNLKKGELKIQLDGDKLRGGFVLVKLKKDEKNWLLIKHKDEYAVGVIYDAEDHVNGKQVVKSRLAVKGRTRKLKKFTSPMLASISKTAFNDKDWIFEIKWDGYRAIGETGKGARLYSRNGLDFSTRCPSIVNALEKIKHEAVIDGEIVLLNERNLPDFQKLQHYENHLNYPLVFYVFDCLWLDGKNLESLPLVKRKQILKKLVGKNPVVRYCDHIEGRGMDFLEKVKEQGLEGIIAKKKDSRYIEGIRSKEWLKLKNVQNTEVVIVGYTEPKGGRTGFGSLVLANKKGSSWKYRGHVGTGFSNNLLGTLKTLMKPL